MFIVDKSGTSVREIGISGIDLVFDYTEDVKNEANKLYKEIIEYNLSYGDRVFSERVAENKTKEFLSKKKTIAKILINDECFGEYEEAKGKFIFEEIISALKNGVNLLDMREFEGNEIF